MKELVARTSPKNLNVFEFIVWSLQQDFEVKMASSQDWTCPCKLLQGAEISPLVCAQQVKYM